MQKKWSYHAGNILLQVIIGIAITGILMAAGSKGYGNMVLKGNIQTAATTLQTYASNIEDGFFNMGHMEWGSGEDVETEFQVFLYEMEDKYLNFSFDYDSLASFDETDCWGITVNTSLHDDPWGAPYKMTYRLDDITGLQIAIASAGPDGNWSERSNSYYQAGEYGDDIVMLLSLRNR